MDITKLKENREKAIIVFCYILIFINFIGVNFLKVNISGLNINVGRILMVISAIILLCILIEKKNIKKMIKECNRTIQYIVKFLLIWGIYSLVSFFFTKDLMNTIINEFFLIFGIISIFLILCVIRKKEEFINILNITEAAMILNTIYALFLNYVMHEKTYGGFYYNVNDLATFFLFGIPSEISLLYIKRKNLKITVLRIIILIIELYTFYLLDSRACKLGVILGCILTIIFIIYKKSTKIKVILEKLNKKKVIIIPILIIVVTIMSILRNTIYR